MHAIVRTVWVAIVSVGTVAGVTARADAQEPLDRRPAASRRALADDATDGPWRGRTRADLAFGLIGFGINGSAPFGGYDGLYGVGAGVEGCLRVHWFTAESDEGAFSLGPVLHLDLLHHGGGSGVDAGGRSLRVDDLTLVTGLFGFHLTGRMGEFRFGPQIGLGVALIGSARAELTDWLGTRSGGFIDQTATVAFDLRLRMGWQRRFESGLRVGIEAFLAYRAFGRPDDAGAGAVMPEADPGAMDGGILGLACTIELAGGPAR